MRHIGSIPIPFNVYNKNIAATGHTMQAGVVDFNTINNLISLDPDYRTWATVYEYSKVIPRPYAVSYEIMKCLAVDAQGNREPIRYVISSQSTTQQPYTYTWACSENTNIDIVGSIIGTFSGDDTICMFAIAVYNDSAGEDLAGYQFVMCKKTTDGGINYIPAHTNWQCFLNLKRLAAIGYTVNEEDFDPDINENPNEPEGYGRDVVPAHNHTSDTIGIPPVPDVSTGSTGFTHVYKVAAQGLAGIGQYLFPAITNITDIESALRTIAGIFGYRDNIQYVVDLHAIPGTVPVGASQYIKIGNLETDIQSPVVSSDYYDFDFGSITVPECYANYIDYIGTKLKLYLPFVGMVDLDPSLVMGGILSVKYRFNAIDGAFMAFVVCSSNRSMLRDTVIAQYGGSACIHLPVIANSYGSLVSGLVSGAAVMAASPTPAVGTFMAATSVMSQQPATQSSNNYNSSTSFLGVRRPYVIIERQCPAMSTKYEHDKGLPLNSTQKIGNVHGYTVIEDIDLSGMDYTKQELDELKSLLASGVYL